MLSKQGVVPTLLHKHRVGSPAVSEETVGFGGGAVLSVTTSTVLPVGEVPEGTSVVSVITSTKNKYVS